MGCVECSRPRSLLSVHCFARPVAMNRILFLLAIFVLTVLTPALASKKDCALLTNRWYDMACGGLQMTNSSGGEVMFKSDGTWTSKVSFSQYLSQ